jgi:hypothetical protein
MAKTSRWRWLLFPVVFGVALRVALWFYWLPARRAWIRAHGGDELAAAYGEGKVDALAVFATVGPTILAFLCCVIGSAPRPFEILVIGVVAAVGTLAVAPVTETWFGSHFGRWGAVCGPGILVTTALIGSYYAWRLLRVRETGPAA